MEGLPGCTSEALGARKLGWCRAERRRASLTPWGMHPLSIALVRRFDAFKRFRVERHPPIFGVPSRWQLAGDVIGMVWLLRGGFHQHCHECDMTVQVGHVQRRLPPVVEGI